MLEDYSSLETHYQIQIPHVLRGLIILLMNESLDEKRFMDELICLNQQLANLLNSYKDASNYFERYIAQLSSE